jgi:hypothetical protein
LKIGSKNEAFGGKPMAQATIVRRTLPDNIPEHIMRRLMGTSADTRAPWETYQRDPLAGCSPELQAEIAEYSQKHHGKTSGQNVEELCRQKELTRNSVKDYKFYRQDELTTEEGKKGRVLHCLEFLRMLEKIRPAYLSSNVRKGLTGLAVYHPQDVLNQETGVIERVDWQYVCACQVPYMWEYSVLHIDPRTGLPLNEKQRGWRTVLLRLIQSGHVTEQQALEVFGEAIGQASRRYREQLFFWRNRKEMEGQERE